MKQIEITNLSLKKDVLSYFFERINYYEYRYIMLKTIDDLKKNEKNIEYVIPHIKGDPYFLVFGTFDRKNLSFLIEKRKLKFNLDQCDIKDIKIYQINYKSIGKTHIGSIFDGRVVMPANIFLIQDCYYLDGIKMNAWKLEKKIEYLDDYISKNFKDTNLKIRKVDLITNIEELDRRVSKSTVEINGYIFLQGRSGISYIFIDNDNFKANNAVSLEQMIDENNQNNNTVKSFNDDALVFLLKKDAKPDVYHVYDKDNIRLHFASVPDTVTSQLCYTILKNTDSAYFKCMMCPKWNRYKPISVA
jgi:hypothetical protein